jgi:hypothetical protein
MKSPLEKLYLNIIMVILKLTKIIRKNINCNIRAGVNQVLEYKIDCDFKAMYGDAFWC